MDAVTTAVIAGTVALIVQGLGVIVLRRSPLAPERQAYIGDLKGRNALLERENSGLEGDLAELKRAFEAFRAEARGREENHRQRIAFLEQEVRRLERENLDFYRKLGGTFEPDGSRT